MAVGDVHIGVQHLAHRFIDLCSQDCASLAGMTEPTTTNDELSVGGFRPDCVVRLMVGLHPAKGLYVEVHSSESMAHGVNKVSRHRN